MTATEMKLTSATSRPAALTLLTTALCVLAISAGQALAATVRLGNVEATAVATVPQPATYEKRAAGELIAYLERISGKRLRQIEISDKIVPAGVIAVGALAKDVGRNLDLQDPESREDYVYKVTGEKAYELSATFRLPREKKQSLFWNHPAGQHSFQFHADSPP